MSAAIYNRGKVMRNSNAPRRFDTVGVPSSILGEPTIFKPKPTDQIVEIARGFVAIPAVEYRNGRFRLYQAIVKTPSKKRDKSVTFKKSKRRSA